MSKLLILPYERILTREESNLIKDIIKKAIETFESWGYDYLKLPTFENYEVYRKVLGHKGKDAIIFKDLSEGEVVSLRVDFTAQVVKSVSFLRVWHFPLRIYYFGTLFSTSGNTYEKFQTGIELIGVGEVEGDAEVISAIYSYLRSLGLDDLTVSVGHVGIVKNILARVEDDKRTEFRRAFKEKNLTLLKDTLGGGIISELPLFQGKEEILGVLDELGFRKEREELELLGRHLSEAGVSYIYDLSEVRDFPYYTGIVFEIFHPKVGSPVAGGGRYDSLSEVYGERFPSTGGTVYVDLLMSLLEPRKEKKDFFVIDLSEDKRFGFKIASILRSKGYKVGRDIVSRAYEHSLDYAFSEGYEKAVVILDEKDVKVYTTVKNFTQLSLKEFLELV